MGTLFCLHSSDRIARKISREINYITKTKKRFEEKSNSFVSTALIYDDEKSKALIDLIKIEISNSNNCFEKRYLYLCLLDKLIIGNVIYLKLSHQNNLLSYIAILFDLSNNKEVCSEVSEKENIALLCNLADSCLNKWYEKYSGMNDESIEFLSENVNKCLANSSYIESNLQENKIDDDLINLNIDKNCALLSEESNVSANLKLQMNLSCPTSSNSVFSDKLIGFEIEHAQGDFFDEETHKMSNNIQFDRTLDKITIVDNEFESEMNEIQEKEDSKSASTQIECTKMGFTDNSNVCEIEKFEVKYNLLKEKYLLLVQKNEFLRSRLEYYEDFNLLIKKATNGDQNQKKNSCELFDNLSSISDLSISFLENFNSLIVNNDWILFEDNLIQIGVKFQFSENIGNFSLYFGNKLPTRLEDFTIKFNCSSVNPRALSVWKKDNFEHPSYISGKQQICLNFSTKCDDAYFGVPTVNIKFLLTDNTPKNIEIPFPIVVSKFSCEIEQYSKDFIIDLWHSEIYLMSQASTQINTKNPVSLTSEVISKCKLNKTFRLFTEVESHKAKDKIIYLHGSVLNRQVIIQVCESTPRSFILRVRSDSGVLSSSILSIVIFQIKNDTF